MACSLDETLPLKPETAEYEVLRVLVAHGEQGVTLTEVTAEIAFSTERAAETLSRLSNAEFIKQENGFYYIDSSQTERVKQRLKSVDAVVELFESTPEDDCYAEAGWEEQITSISLEEEPES